MNTLIEIYNRSDKTQANWYRLAHNDCVQVATSTGISLEIACAIVAVISPRLPWDKNISEAIEIIKGNTTGRMPYRSNVEKAVRILDGEPIENVLSGRKVTNFYHNLLSPESPEYVTIDTWAMRALLDDYTWTKSLTPKQYDQAAQAYKEAAKSVGILPCEFQAAIWEEIRK